MYLPSSLSPRVRRLISLIWASPLSVLMVFFLYPHGLMSEAVHEACRPFRRPSHLLCWGPCPPARTRPGLSLAPGSVGPFRRATTTILGWGDTFFEYAVSFFTSAEWKFPFGSSSSKSFRAVAAQPEYRLYVLYSTSRSFISSSLISSCSCLTMNASDTSNTVRNPRSIGSTRFSAIAYWSASRRPCHTGTAPRISQSCSVSAAAATCRGWLRTACFYALLRV